MGQFIEFITDWRAVLQIVLLFSMIYLAMYHLRNTHGSLVMAGLLMFIGSLWCLARALDLDVITRLLEMILGSLFLMLMIIFQPELRRALARLGSLAIFENRRRRELINEVIAAVLDMAKRKCGAIIVIECKVRLQTLIDDAIIMDAKVNSLMLESIFFPNSPLHDGAVIIRDDRIVAARAILPLSGSEKISRQLGTRHRAALGISEESDAVTVLVSEESGAVSIGHDGKLYRDLSAGELRKLLDTLIVQKETGDLDETIIQINDQDYSDENSVSTEADK
ncbi:MAG: diadenylate cyclase CdaA [Lentisphaeria bacterium]|nr:TIGR00159 family protein [Lentisphaerota bacterium]MBR2626432.1 diadenylate cyclase CdaA [Lentisphaeria bacterium]